MRIMRSIFAGLGAGLFVIAALSPVVMLPAYAQNIQTQSYQRAPQPREFQTQQVHYLRFTLTFQSCTIPPGAATCFVRVGALPYNSWILPMSWQINTTFNPTTSATIGVGLANATNTTQPGAGILAAVSVFTGASTTANVNVTTAGIGQALVGNAATIPPEPIVLYTGGTQTPNLVVPVTGGFSIYATYTTGANGSQGTQGSATFILPYIAPNDGQCAPFLIDQAITAVVPFTAC